MKRTPYLTIGLVLALTAWGCSGSGQKDKPRPSGGDGESTVGGAGSGPVDGAGSPNPATAPAFRLLCGEGGGVTGQWNGMVLETDGRLATWHGIDAESAPRTPVGTATADERNRLWSTLTRAGFFTRAVDEKGNMTRFVRVEAATETSMWNWSLMPGPDSTGRSTVWNACQNLARQVQAREDR